MCEGVYTINVIDSLGYPATQIVSVGGVLPLTCLVGVSKNATTDTSNDGEITVFSVYGGVPPYTFKLQNSLGVIINSIASPSIPYTFTGLDADVLGYTVTVEDSASSLACVTTGLTITGPSPLILTPAVTDATCSNVADGKILLTYGGGQPPYNLETTGTTYTSFISTSANLTGLLPDTYISTLTDSMGNIEVSTSIVGPTTPPLVGSGVIIGNTYTISANGGTPPYSVTYGPTTTSSFTSSITFTSQTPYSSVTLLDSVGCSIPIDL